MSGIIVVPYNPEWPAIFAKAKEELEKVLIDIPYIAIEHIGSTSIPDLYAKPIIDIDIVVAESPNDEAMSVVTSALVKAGYRAIGNSRIPGRFAFWQPRSGYRGNPPRGEMRRNTYVVIEGCLSLRNHRDLKRILSEDAESRKEYGDVKRALVRDELIETVEEYCSGKNVVVSRILKKAGWTQEELDVVTNSNLYGRRLLDF